MTGKGKQRIEAFGYIRTSSASSVGDGKDSEVRQRKAIESYARAAGGGHSRLVLRCGLSGADPVEARPGFTAALARIAGNGVRTIVWKRLTALPAILESDSKRSI